MSGGAEPPRQIRWDRPCPECSVRALLSRIGTRRADCAACGYGEELQEPVPAPPPTPERVNLYHPIVYYLRFADRVKIGTTTNLERRLSALPHDEVLATEPGSYDVEKRRHLQFRASRIYANREWFHYTQDIADHIATLTGG